MAERYQTRSHNSSTYISVLMSWVIASRSFFVELTRQMSSVKLFFSLSPFLFSFNLSAFSFNLPVSCTRCRGLTSTFARDFVYERTDMRSLPSALLTNMEPKFGDNSHRETTVFDEFPRVFSIPSDDSLPNSGRLTKKMAAPRHTYACGYHGGLNDYQNNSWRIKSW